MKTAVISVCYSTERLEVLWQYRTEAELQEGLESVLPALYEKYVPSEVRERIEAAVEGGA